MPLYYDSIEEEYLSIDNKTIVYLTENNDNTFSLHAISVKMEELQYSPVEGATEYWLIDINTIKNQFKNVLIYPNFKLTEAPLTLEQVQEHLALDPRKAEKKAFNVPKNSSYLSTEAIKEYEEYRRQQNTPSILRDLLMLERLAEDVDPNNTENSPKIK